MLPWALCGFYKVGLLFQQKTQRLLISKPGGLGPMSAGILRALEG